MMTTFSPMYGISFIVFFPCRYAPTAAGMAMIIVPNPRRLALGRCPDEAPNTIVKYAESKNAA